MTPKLIIVSKHSFKLCTFVSWQTQGGVD